jgi:predicted nucleic acid-binding protein
MRYWDASAIVPLLVDEPRTGRARDLRDEDTQVVVWWGTPVECASALARLRREGALSAAEGAADALQLAAALEWAGTPASGEVVTFDERLPAAAELEGSVIV